MSTGIFAFGHLRHLQRLWLVSMRQFFGKPEGQFDVATEEVAAANH